MAFLIQRQLSKIRTLNIFFSSSRRHIWYSTQPLTFERVAGKDKLDYIHSVNSIRKASFHLLSNNSYQKTITMKSQRVHTNDNGPNRKYTEDKKWNRIVTIQQVSKNNNNKVMSLDVSVLDTHPDDIGQKRSTVVAVHGFPGSGNDFELIATKLHEKGIRLVAPTSLGMMESPITFDLLSEIDFSTDGRARSLRLILKAMNIHRIDMLVGHSAGAWTMYKAGASWDNIGSLFGINPGGDKPNRPIRPFLFFKFIAAVLQWSLGRLIVTPFLAFTYRIIGFRDVISTGSDSHLIVTQQYIASQGFPQVPVNADEVRKRQLPVLFTYSLNDKILEHSICSHMAYNVLRIPKQNTVTYADDKTPNRDPFFVPEGWLTRCLVFARGGHIIHLAHAKEVVDQIENMLRCIDSSKNTYCNLSDQKDKNRPSL